jgi:hypothetical protein
MKTATKLVILVASGAVLLCGALCGTVHAQSTLIESGSSILSPSLAPTGGYASNPQEYLNVGWMVVESGSGVYTYSYTVQNPAGDVILNSTGGLTSTPEIADSFSIDLNTAIPNAYLPGTQTGGAFQEVNTIGLAWFFYPSISAGSTGPTVSFQSDLPPIMGNGSADGGVPPGPWSTVSLSGQEVPIPNAPIGVAEPTTTALFALTALLLLPFRAVARRIGELGM